MPFRVCCRPHASSLLRELLCEGDTDSISLAAVLRYAQQLQCRRDSHAALGGSLHGSEPKSGPVAGSQLQRTSSLAVFMAAMQSREGSCLRRMLRRCDTAVLLQQLVQDGDGVGDAAMQLAAQCMAAGIAKDSPWLQLRSRDGVQSDAGHVHSLGAACRRLLKLPAVVAACMYHAATCMMHVRHVCMACGAAMAGRL
jgi:hypothetical protein